MTTGLLRDAAERLPTEFWCDSAGADELAWAIANGATGATSNPPIVLGILRGERAAWRRRARELHRDHPTWGESEIAWRLIEEIAVRGAGMLAPVFERTGGARGRLSAQVLPTLARDRDAMLSQAERLASLAPNIQVKLPVTAAGLAAIEEATARGVPVNATANFTVAGALAVAEAVERGLERRAAAGLPVDLHPVCTLMLGRLDDWVKAASERDGVLLAPGRAEWAGVAVFKRAYALYRERGFRTRLLAGAFRHHLPWSQLLGGDIVITVPPSWQRWLETSHLRVESRIDDPVEKAIVDELLELSPEFRLAYEPAGLALDELGGYGASVRTMRQFLAAWTDIQSEVRDAVLPNPDLAATHD